MDKLEQQYLNLLKDILENGVKKEDRTGTGTISVFGRQIRHNMSDGFPLLTTKKMAWKSIVTELLWFLRGDTNIKYLVDNDCHIWDGDAYKSYLSKWSYEKYPNDGSVVNIEPIKVDPHTKEQFIYRIKTDDEFANKWGELGPVYGRMWRTFDEDADGGIDQIANLINDLETNPDSRRLLVTAWNPTYLPHQVLPPCHYGFQIYTRELSRKEKIEYLFTHCYETGMERQIVESSWTDENFHDEYFNVPKRAISLMWNQRSVDTFLGLPFNIASYGLLLEIIAKSVNMVPDELIGNLGDTHLYLNHIEQAKEQIGRELTTEERNEWHLVNRCGGNKRDCKTDWRGFELDQQDVPKRTREPYPLPTLKINSGNENWHLLDIDDIVQSLDTDITFKLENYQSHPTIKAPLSN